MDLHTACSCGEYSYVRELLDGGADVNRPNVELWTPLAYACYGGHDNVAYVIDLTLRGRRTVTAQAHVPGLMCTWRGLASVRHNPSHRALASNAFLRVVQLRTLSRRVLIGPVCRGRCLRARACVCDSAG